MLLRPSVAGRWFPLPGTSRQGARCYFPVCPDVAPATGGVATCAPVDKPSVAFGVTGLASAGFAPFVVAALVCDLDEDDKRLVQAALDHPASGPNDPRDLNGDGRITGLDVSALVHLCTRRACATQ